jgi:hypothetical protein
VNQRSLQYRFGFANRPQAGAILAHGKRAARLLSRAKRESRLVLALLIVAKAYTSISWQSSTSLVCS